MNTPILYLDIETIPAQRPDILEEIRADCAADLEASLASIAAPANYKDPAKIEEWMSTIGAARRLSLQAEHDTKVDECYRKTALDGAFGQVCAIGWAFGMRHPCVTAGMDESLLLAGFMEAMRGGVQPADVFSTQVVGHNVVGFDLRFILQRCIVRGIRPHPLITRSANAKPWESEKVYDTMVQWTGGKGGISLARLCRALGVECSTGTMDGSQVWDLVKAGKLDEVSTYCAGDVRDVREVHRRMIFATAEQMQAA